MFMRQQDVAGQFFPRRRKSLPNGRGLAKRRLLVESLETRRMLHAPGAPVLELEVAHGVTFDSATGQVSQWNDQSGNGNHVTSAGTLQPTFGQVQTPTGAGAIRFDGVNDRLLRSASSGINALPSGNASRSVFLVAQFHDASAWSGFGYGAGTSNEAFGVGIVASGANEGKYFLQGWGSGNDLISNQLGYTPPNGPTNGWGVLSIVHTDDGTNPANNAFLYFNGVQIAAWSHVYATDTTDTTVLNGNAASRITLGQEIKELGNVRFDVAAALIYNEAVTPALRQSIESYLTTEYVAGDLVPQAVNDTFTTQVNMALTIPQASLLSNDTLGNAPTTILSFNNVTTRGGTVTTNAGGDLVYTPPSGATGVDTFNYTIRDVDLDVSSATVTITINAFTTQNVVAGLVAPISIRQLPDGRMLVLEKAGTIKIFDPSATVPTATTYLTIPNVQSTQERGLTDIAIDPNFATNNYFYVYYSSSTNNRLRISRFTHNGNSASAASETIIWQDNESFHLSQQCCHYGGGLDFGPDGRLYLTIGDKWRTPAESQDLNRAAGKILRINKDGSIPSDNPFFDGAGPNRDEVWAYGLRNPFRARWDLPTGRFIIGDVGGNVQNIAREEINLGVAGRNYGWPAVEGIVPSADFPTVPAGGNYQNPIFEYGHEGTTPNGGAIAGGLVYRGTAFPAEFQGAYFFADYVNGWIRYLKFDANGAVIDANPATSVIDAFEFSNDPIAPVALTVGADGALYYVDYFTNQVRRIVYNPGSGNQAPVITQATATPTAGPNAPLTVSFSGTATDPENSPLTYTWLFGDGTQANGQNVNHAYTSKGRYQARLQVSDGTLTTVSNPIEITVGSVPVIQSLLPADGTLFRAGTSLNLSAIVTDADSTLTGANYSWTVRFIHNAHTHPEFDNVSGLTQTLNIPTTGHDYSDSTGYEISLTVTDSDGLSATSTNRIYPEKVNVTIGTNFPGVLTYTLDGLPRTGNFVLDSAINFQHTLIAPATATFQSTNYVFAGWSNGTTSPTNVFTVPTNNLTLTANYVVATGGLITNNLVLRLDAQNGVTTNGNTVTGWTDLSGRGNNLIASGNPQLVANGLNGLPVITLDGVDDKLTRTLTLNGLPANGKSRSIFVVAKYDSNGYGGFTYGDNANNQAFGTVVGPNGNLFVQGWAGANDFDSGDAGVGQGWLIQEVTLAGGQLRHYKDGTLIDSRTHTFKTDVTAGEGIAIGSEIDGNPFLNMSIAEVLVYDVLLTDPQRQQVESYLQTKYFGSGGSSAITPTAPIALFNGQDLTGLSPWIAGVGASDPQQIYRVENGQLHVTGDAIGALTTNNSYRNYVMVLEFKWGDETFAPRLGKAKDAGLIFHTNGDPGSWFGQLTPGIQSQIMEGGMGDIIVHESATEAYSVTANSEQLVCGQQNWNCRGGYRYSPTGTPRTFDTDLGTIHSSTWDRNWRDNEGFRSSVQDIESPDADWNQMVVVANGDIAEIFVNGVKVNEITGLTRTEGSIQLEVDRAEYFVRRWELLPLGTAAGPVITTNQLAGANAGQAYSQTVGAKGLSTPITFSVVGGTLPAGLSLAASTGVISGTPTIAGTANFSIRALDAAGLAATSPFSIVVTGTVNQPKLRTGVVTVNSSGWTNINLEEVFQSQVVVATVVNNSSGPPVVTRVQNATGSSFDLRIDRADGQTGNVSAQVHYVVVEEGVYTDAQHGVKFEAIKTLSNTTDNKNSWTGQNLLPSLANSYTNPVVLGQVQTYNDARWSAFWSRGTARNEPVSSTAIFVGKHVGEDTVTARGNETIGVIVIEQGSGHLDGVDYVAAVGADTIRGVDNGGDTYAISIDVPIAAIASQTGMDSTEGGWAVLNGPNPVGLNLRLAIDEDRIADAERSHTTEQVGYLVFYSHSGSPEAPLASTSPEGHGGDDHEHDVDDNFDGSISVEPEGSVVTEEGSGSSGPRHDVIADPSEHEIPKHWLRDIASGILRVYGTPEIVDLSELNSDTFASLDTIDLRGFGVNRLLLPPRRPELDDEISELLVSIDRDDILSFAEDWELLAPEFRSDKPYHRLVHDGTTVLVFDDRQWTNPLERADVNRDNNVSPRDALIILNNIAQERSSGNSALSIESLDRYYLDASGDGKLTVRDALVVINQAAKLARLRTSTAPLIAAPSIESDDSRDDLLNDQSSATALVDESMSPVVDFDLDPPSVLEPDAIDMVLTDIDEDHEHEAAAELAQSLAQSNL